MEELVPAFKQSIFNTNLTGLVASIAEVGIDSILSDGILKDLPFFNLLLGASHTMKNVQERNLLKNTALFLDGFNSKKIDELIIHKYREKLNDERIAEQELGRVLILLNQYVDNMKSNILGRLFKDYVDQKYTWEKFCELSDVLSRLFLNDVSYLFQIANSAESKTVYHIYRIPYNVKRLESLGLVEIYGEYGSFGDRLLQTENMYAALTENGLVFSEMGKDMFRIA